MKSSIKNKVLAALLCMAMLFTMAAAPISATTTENRYSCVSSGYLALRSAPAYNDANVIYQIWTNGTQLCMTGQYSGDYGYCYCPAAGKYGWVNVKYTTTSPSGGTTSSVRYSCVSSGYLALRSAPAYNDANVIYQIWTNGTQLNMTGQTSGDYGYCYCPAAGKYGWVNMKYTVASWNGNPSTNTAPATNTSSVRYSCVSSGYLALRSAPAYNDANVIYQIWTNGTQLNMTGQTSGEYGYCYCPAAGKSGWVNMNYTVASWNGNSNTNTSSIRYSNVQSGYLALRSAPAYDDSNVIYQIWTNGTQLNMTGQYSGDYGYCYCPAAGMSGWVNVKYTRS